MRFFQCHFILKHCQRNFSDNICFLFACGSTNIKCFKMETQKCHVMFSNEFRNCILTYCFHFRHALCCLCANRISLCFYHGISSSTHPHYFQSESSITLKCPSFVHQNLICKVRMKYSQTPRPCMAHLLVIFKWDLQTVSITFSNVHILINIDLVWLLVAATCVNLRICPQTISNMIFQAKISLKFYIKNSLLNNPEAKPELSDLKPGISLFLFSFVLQNLDYSTERKSLLKQLNCKIYSFIHISNSFDLLAPYNISIHPHAKSSFLLGYVFCEKILEI